MKRSLLRSLGSALAGLMLAAALVGGAAVVAPSAAFAQEEKINNAEYGVEIGKPKGWEQSTGNEKAVAIFTDPKTQSQIEVVPTKLMTADVADVFFSTFHKTLTESNFQKDGDTQQQKIGEFDGKLTVYKFTHSGVTLHVHVFSFVRDSTAWLVVGYMQDSAEADGKAQYKMLIESLKFKA
jgi:hypothetical protein